MNSQQILRAAARPRVSSIVVALFATLFSLGLLTAPSASASPVAIEEGHLEWGLKQSWRDYINRITIGPVDEGERGTSLGGGATPIGDTGVADRWTFRFPLESGSYDPDTRRTELQFGGWVHFRQHCGGLFGGDVAAGCGLDMLIAEPRVEISEERTSIYARMVSRPRDGGDLIEYPEVNLAGLDIDAVDPVTSGATTDWTAIPSTLTAAGGEIFTYPTGSELDPVSISYSGPGGKPLLEQWATPGEVVYESSQQPADLSGMRLALADDTNSELHAIGAGATSFQVLDGSSLEPLASDGAIEQWSSSSAALSSEGTDRITFAVGRESAGGDWSIQAMNWDGTTLTREAIPGATFPADVVPGGGVYSINDGAYFVVIGAVDGASQNLWRVTGEPGDWTGEDMGPIQQGGTDVASLFSSLGLAPNGGIPLVTRVIGANGGGIHALLYGSGTVNASQSGFVPNFPFAVSSATKHIVASKAGSTEPRAHEDNLTNLFTIEDGVVRHWPAIMGFSFPRRLSMGSSSGTAEIPGSNSVRPAVSPVDGKLYVADSGLGIARFDKAAGILVPSETVREHAFVAEGAGSIVDDSLVGVDFQNRLLVRSDEGSVLAYDYRGVTPEVSAHPQDTTVALVPPATSAQAEFTVSAGGSPEPEIRWQSRLPGASGWTDLADGDGVSGSASESLVVAVGAADARRQFRAVLGNSAGELASDAARLEVQIPPAVGVAPQSTAVRIGQAASFGVLVTGNPEPEIQWQMRVNGIWLNLPDQQLSTLEFESVETEMNGAVFRARLRNSVHTAFTAPVTLSVGSEQAGPASFGGGHVDWGVAERWRCYVVGSVAQGSIEVTGGATRIPGTEASGALCPSEAPGSQAIRFPVLGGIYDPASDRLELTLGGSVRFTGHAHHVPGDSTPQLDTRLSGLRIVAEDDTGLLYADTVGATLENPEPVSREDVALVALDLSGVEPVSSDVGMTWDGVSSSLTADGAEVFGSYPAGEAFDPVSMAPLFGEPQDPEPFVPVPVGDQPERSDGADDSAGPSPRVPRVVAAKGMRRLRGRSVPVARIACPAGGPVCRVKVRQRTRARIGRKWRAVRVIAPRRVAPGRRALVLVRVSRADAKRLRARRGVVRVRIVVGNGKRKATAAMVHFTGRPVRR